MGFFFFLCQDDKCPVQAAKGMCFDNKNRERWSLSFIHSSNIPGAEVKMDMINQALYYNWVCDVV